MTLMENVTRLNRVDTQIRALKHRIRSAEIYHRAQLRQVEELEGRLKELTARRKSQQTKLASLEVDAAALDGRAEKFRGDLNSSSTNKQYTAVLTELNDVKAQRGRVDEAMMAEMETIESIEREIGEVTTQRDERAKVVELAAQRLAEREQEAASSLQELSQQRTLMAASIPDAAMRVLEAAAKLHDDDPLAIVEEIDRRHRVYACGGCNIDVPFEIVSTLTSAAVISLVCCPNCGRILHMHEEVRGALATPK